jgi:mono/diheme cytochrome c family protein
MSEVTDNLATVPASDVRAIATYMASVAGPPSDERRRKAGEPREQAGGPGAAIYAAACASCHDGTRTPPFGGIDLALSTGPSGPTARNVVNVILWGLPAEDEQHRPIMPGFADVLNDRQLADLLAYVRARFSGKPAWTEVEKEIHAARSGDSRVHPGPVPGLAHAVPGKQEARQ